MEKLELKHLAPYLPYNLLLCVPSYKKDYIMNYVQHWSKRSTCRSIVEVIHQPNGIKPYLRHLTQLKEEIKHNDCIFVPLNQINKNLGLKAVDKKFVMHKDGTYGIRDFIFNENIKYHTEMELPLVICEMLFEWHFDVFGLIEKGLALSYNEIK